MVAIQFYWVCSYISNTIKGDIKMGNIIKINGIEIEKDPKGGFTDEYLDKGRKNIDFVVSFDSSSIKDLKEFLKGYNTEKEKIIYIHQYKDEFSIGIKELKKKDYYI